MLRQAALCVSRIEQLEQGRQVPTKQFVQAIHNALEEAGISFVAEIGEGPGVRLRRPSGERLLPNATGLPLAPAIRTRRPDLELGGAQAALRADR